MRVLAFDPGYERLGVAVVEKNPPAGGGKDILLHSECVRTSAKLPFSERLAALGDAAEKLLREWGPTVVALEEVYFEKNVKTAIQVAQVMGMLSYIAARSGLVVHRYTPLEVKVAITGYGRGDKAAVAAMVPRLVALPARKRLDDELDAIAIGLTCLASVRG
jgi:crossover junction endodeoxyribonuclease RuvC